MKKLFRHISGFVLQDLMLGLIVVSIMTAMAMPYLTDARDSIAAKAVSDEWSLFKQVAGDHFKANRAAYISAMQDGTGAATICKINVSPIDGTGGVTANSTTLHTCAVDTSQLRYLRVWPVEMPLGNAYRERWVAIFKLEYDTTPAPTGGVSMFVASADVTGAGAAVDPDAAEYARVQTAAGFLGGEGGAVPDADRATCKAVRATTTYEACGGGWRVNLADYIDAASLTAFGNRLAN